MIDFKSKLDEKADVSVEVFENFHTFLMDNLFNELPEGAEVELAYGFTTLSYLQVRYLIRMPRNHNVLSMVILGAKSFKTKEIFTDYLRTDFAVINKDFSKMVTGIKVFEDNFEPFKEYFKEAIIPMYQKNKWEV
ncbi:hypothetical protein CVD28_02580 [Bacillus sp. M6-12]|uniref:hypothetical protein n=1 Tax=Bacillus sp. M6-12 TaxID=2054166 RepID=UPI000C78D5D0|nr:hypothetical protein [Bacillus sp. M6-12]PLS19318.1 hypothetical protein CVD28_02580 [Bacillus sp. M6-12]